MRTCGLISERILFDFTSLGLRSGFPTLSPQSSSVPRSYSHHNFYAHRSERDLVVRVSPNQAMRPFVRPNITPRECI